MIAWTPEEAEIWSERIEEGLAEPYALIAFTTQDWITFKSWLNRMRLWVLQTRQNALYYRGDANGENASETKND